VRHDEAARRTRDVHHRSRLDGLRPVRPESTRVQGDVEGDLAGRRVVVAHGVLPRRRHRTRPPQHQPVRLRHPQGSVRIREDQLDVLVRRVGLEARRTGPAEDHPQQARSDHPDAADPSLADSDRVGHLLGSGPRPHLGDPLEMAAAVVRPARGGGLLHLDVVHE
jgi:hypothetical protein